MRVIRHRRSADPGLLMLRTVCHELRPPMAILTSLVSAMADQPSGDRRAEMARLAVAHAAHAQSVLEQAAASVPGVADRAEPLHRVLPVALGAVPAERLALDVSRAALAWPVHPRHTRQVLINLLGNALRHGALGGSVRLRAHVRARRLRLTVVNAGPATRDLFSALRRPDPPPGEKGLGLWVVRQAVAANGGTVRARSRSTGVEVEVRLPARR
jgi:two-component system, OmpR family, sensor kinase